MNLFEGINLMDENNSSDAKTWFLRKKDVMVIYRREFHHKIDKFCIGQSQHDTLSRKLLIHNKASLTSMSWHEKIINYL